jgi:hypothetical protein
LRLPRSGWETERVPPLEPFEVEEDLIVKRTATIALLSVGLTIASAATALAANYPPTPGNGGGGNSGGAGGSSGLASTGANVSLGMIVLVALVAVGIAALVIGRRRARA